jgi:hypothetical protein
MIELFAGITIIERAATSHNVMRHAGSSSSEALPSLREKQAEPEKPCVDKILSCVYP